MNDTADKISKILEDPESIKMITEIAESIIGGNTSQERTNQEISTTDTGTVNEEINSSEQEDVFDTVLSSVKKISEHSDIDNTMRLISALKPYMGSRRRESADSVVKILKIIKMAGDSNLPNMIKLFSGINK